MGEGVQRGVGFGGDVGEEINSDSIREACSDPQESRSGEEDEEGAPLDSGFRGEVGEEL